MNDHTTFGSLLPMHRYNPRTNFVERVPATSKDRESNVPTPDDSARGVDVAGTLGTCRWYRGPHTRSKVFCEKWEPLPDGRIVVENLLGEDWTVTPHLKGFVKTTPGDHSVEVRAYFNKRFGVCQNGPTCDHPFCPEHNDFPESFPR